MHRLFRSDLPAGLTSCLGFALGFALAAGPAFAGEVARAQFTSSVNEREPVDDVAELTNDSRQIYFFSELRELRGQQITHRWEYNGQTVAEVPFQVGADRWRVWSTKKLDPLQVGEWKASIVDAEGNVLATETFTYSIAGQPEPTPEPAPTAATREPEGD